MFSTVSKNAICCLRLWFISFNNNVLIGVYKLFICIIFLDHNTASTSLAQLFYHLATTGLLALYAVLRFVAVFVSDRCWYTDHIGVSFLGNVGSLRLHGTA